MLKYNLPRLFEVWEDLKESMDLQILKSIQIIESRFESHESSFKYGESGKNGFKLGESGFNYINIWIWVYFFQCGFIGFIFFLIFFRTIIASTMCIFKSVYYQFVNYNRIFYHIFYNNYFIRCDFINIRIIKYTLNFRSMEKN